MPLGAGTVSLFPSVFVSLIVGESTVCRGSNSHFRGSALLLGLRACAGPALPQSVWSNKWSQKISCGVTGTRRKQSHRKPGQHEVTSARKERTSPRGEGRSRRLNCYHGW